MTDEIKQIYFPNRASWRDWLSQNYLKEKSIWLVHDRFSSPENRLSYEDIVEEALCFGWIDSTVKKVDSQRGMIYLSVRKPKSIWAQSNKDRIERLTKAKLITPYGLEIVKKAKEDGSWSAFDVVEALIIPEELKKAFAKNTVASKNFDNFSTSVKKQILYHIYSAKQRETKEKRVQKIVTAAIQNKNPFF